MKKILFATTALVATASVAAADVSFSGYGRFGALDTGTASGTYSRLRLQIDMSTEADNGIKFGARLRYQATTTPLPGGGNAGSVNAFNAARFYAKAGGFELGVGNIFGAIEFMPNVYLSGTQSADVGLSGLGFRSLVTNTAQKGYWGWDAYSSGGAGASTRDGVEIRFSQGDFSGHLSYSTTGAVDVVAAFVAYKFNGWTVALGMQDSDVNTNDKTVLTVGGKIGDANVALAYADNDGVGKFAIKGVVPVGAATKVSAFVASEDGAGESYGLGISHSLGGGASIEAGYSSDDPSNNDRWDMGIRFNF